MLFVIPVGNSEPDGTVVTGHPLFGEPAPEIELESLDGDIVRLSDLRGRPVLINFWATWCIPCRDEFPLMVLAYDEYRDDGLEILGVIHDDGPEGARDFAAEQGALWPMLKDPDDVAWDAYFGAAMPTSLFIDREGVVRAFSLGPFSETGLQSQIERILSTEASGTD